MARRPPHRCRLPALAVALVTALPVIAQAPLAYRVITNPANTVSELDKSFLAHVFLKKITRWPDGEPILPVDQAPGTAVRRAFSEDVIGRPVAAIRNFWEEAIFDGRNVPPPELDSDEEVVDYVLRHPGAIGYVSPRANVKNAHVVAVR